jgi:LPS-assembly protein
MLFALAVLTFWVFMPASGFAAEDRLGERMKAIAGAREPVAIQADKVEYDARTRIYTATGNVKVLQGGTTLTADKVALNEETGEAEAVGTARLVTETNVIFADSMKVNFNTKLGVIEKGSIFVKRGNYHIKGNSLERIGEDEYLITSGDMTTCDAKLPFWRVTAGRLDVRMNKDLVAKNVVFRIREVPVLYLPYAWFPLLKPRTSGLLFPSAGYSTSEGVRFFISYYWAPLDNFDTTLSLDYRGRRGTGVAADMRFALGKDTDTNFYGYFMDDRKAHKERYNISLKHEEQFTDSLSGRADINLSDRQFYRDLTDSAKERTQRSIDSNLFLTNRWDWGRAYFFSQYAESLIDINSGVIVQRLPDVGLNVVKEQLFDAPVYLDIDGSAAYFYKKEGVDGGRFDVFPRVSGDFNLAGINFSPKAGYRETVYDLSRNVGDKFDDERGFFGAGLKVQTDLYRLYVFEGGPFEGIRHTVEPLVAYNYVVRRGGSDFPVFDGVDTLGRRDMVAYSLTNRFVIKYRDRGATPRVDFISVKLSQFYDVFKDNRVSDTNRYFSTLYGEITYRSSLRFTLNNNFRYDLYGGTMLSVNTDLRYDAASKAWHVGLGQRFSTDAVQTFMSPSRFDFFTPSTDFVSDFISSDSQESRRLNFLTVEAGIRIGGHWEVTGKVWYDIHTGNFRETDATATYTSQCWGVTANYMDRPRGKQIMVTLDFKGIGNIKL